MKMTVKVEFNPGSALLPEEVTIQMPPRWRGQSEEEWLRKAERNVADKVLGDKEARGFGRYSRHYRDNPGDLRFTWEELPEPAPAKPVTQLELALA